MLVIWFQYQEYWGGGGREVKCHLKLVEVGFSTRSTGEEGGQMSFEVSRGQILNFEH